MEDLGITIRFQGETLQFDKNVSGMTKAINTLKREVKSLNKDLKIDPQNIVTITNKMRNLYQQLILQKKISKDWLNTIQQLSADGKQFTKEWTEANEKYFQSEEAVKNIQRQMDKLNGSIEEAKVNAGELADVFDKASDVAGGIADSLEPISNATGGFLKEAIDGAIEFEDAFADVEKTVNTSDEGFAKIREELRDLATELPTSASDLAHIAGLAGQMNVPAEQIAEFTRAMVDFGNSTDITAEKATEDIAQIYNVIGKGGDFSDLDNVLSAIVELGNNSATTESKIVEMFRNISAGASRVGMTEAEMVALASTLSSLGLDKGGASAISKIMTRIDMAVTQGGEDLSAWAEIAKLSGEEFSKAWSEDSANVLLQIVTSMSQMSDEGISMNQILSDLDISEIRQVDTISRLANANEEYAKNIKLANDAYEDGTALSKEAQKRYDTVASKILILKNNLMEFALTIGDMLLPYVDWFVESLGQLTDWLNNLSPHTKMLITRIAGIIAIASPLMRVVQKGLGFVATTIRFVGSLNGIFGTLFGVLKSMWGFLAPVLGQVISFMANHAGWIGILMVLIGVVSELYQNCAPFREFVDNLIKKVQELWDKFKQTNWIEVLGEKFGWFGEIIGALIELIKTLLDWFGKLINKALEFLGLKDSVAEFASGIGGHGSGLQKGLGGNIAMSQSGGFNSGGSMTLNANFSVYTNEVTRADIKSWARWIADDINEELGRRM